MTNIDRIEREILNTTEGHRLMPPESVLVAAGYAAGEIKYIRKELYKRGFVKFSTGKNQALKELEEKYKAFKVMLVRSLEDANNPQ